MYQNCIYCSARLGENQAIEAFPVGRRVAFDAVCGRLWAICEKCGRWNLAPLEERWEPVEEAERSFRDARLRAQSENIGLAMLADGTRLIRVGEALTGELAAWRYGDQLVRRRRQYLITAGVAGTGLLLLAGGLAWATASAGMFSMIGNSHVFVRHWKRRRVVHHVPAETLGTRHPLQLRRWHLELARLVPGEGGSIALQVQHPWLKDQPLARWGRPRPDPDPLVLPDGEARRAVARGAVHLNAQGASRRTLGEALELLTAAGSAESYVRQVAREPRRLFSETRTQEPALNSGHRLALEMALHEEEERRALEGELAVLEAAWRDAEEIAAIADRLALDPAGIG